MAGLLFVPNNITIAASSQEKVSYIERKKIYSDANESNLFSSNSVIVILNSKNTYSFKEYSKKDFPGINCVSVEELTKETSKLVEKQLNYEINIQNEINTKNTIDLNNFRRILRLNLKSDNKKTILKAISKLEKSTDFDYVGPDYISMEASNYPMNPSILDNNQWAHSSIDLPEAWDICTGSSDVLVGVIDTGINGTHPDLINRTSNNLHMDFSGNIPVSLSTPVDSQSHGTHVAGIIGAEANEEEGITGVCWDVDIVSLRINVGGFWYSSRAIQAVDYATANGIDVLNYSGRVRDEATNTVNINDPAFSQAIQNYPGLFVAAAGNYSSNNDVSNAFPANYSLTHNNVISVGAIDINDDKPSFSNYGLNSVNIYAPGVDIKSTVPGGYDNYQGTSMAAPYVTGVAALLLSINPNLSGAQLKNALIASASNITIDVNSGSSQNVKKLNAFNAVKYVLNQYSDTANLKYGNKVLSKSIDSSSSYFVQKNYMLKLVVQNSYIYDFAISASNSLNMTLYDSNFNVLSTITGGTQINFSRELSVGTYYLKTSYNDSSVQGSINITIYGEEHTHSCSDWAYYNRSLHRSICSCGQQITRPHVVSASATGRFKPCLECGYLLDMNYDIGIVGPFSLNLMVTSNGSYILPSGIIVLVDEDIEAYFNDTLVFYQSGTIIS